MSYVLIVGAKSDIAKALAREYAKNGYNLYLAGRRIDELNDFRNDLVIRNERNVVLMELDVVNFSSHSSFYNNLPEKPQGVIFVAGYMAEQAIAQTDWVEAINTINVNYTGAVSILNIAANDFEHRRSGFIIGISSVAGDRGRKANYIYGSAKAGFSAYLSGLRNRLCSAGVEVLTVKPGFVATKMTKGLALPARLTVQPEKVARDVFAAQNKRNNVLYSKWIWQYIMLIVRHIPEGLFKKMNI